MPSANGTRPPVDTNSTETTTDAGSNETTTTPNYSTTTTLEPESVEPSSPEQTTTEAATTTESPDQQAAAASLPFDDSHILPGRSGIVQLLEWKFSDIAKECEDFLGPNGFAAVQTSPVNENLVIAGRPWYERYQPMSYEVRSRSGIAKEFLDMTQRCRRVGVRIYVDVVPNHMSANAPAPASGTGGSVAIPSDFFYPAIPYNRSHFHQPPCAIKNSSNPVEARVCELDGKHDLNQSLPHVQRTLANFLNYLTAMGAAGFRIDSAKNIYPEQLEKIYTLLNPLSTAIALRSKTYPFIYQEVADDWKFNYTQLGAVTEFEHATNMANFFKGKLKPSALADYGSAPSMLPSKSALVFVDNPNLQRQNPNTLNYKSPRQLRAAYAFTLAHPYGMPRIMSSFKFKSNEDGPPHDRQYAISSPRFSKGQCRGDWVCEHRWPAITNMIAFRNQVEDSPLTNFLADNSNGVVGFCRGDKGFVLVSSGAKDYDERVQTCLPAGTYCNTVYQKRTNGMCEHSARVVVRTDGTAQIKISKNDDELVVALHAGDVIELSSPVLSRRQRANSSGSSAPSQAADNTSKLSASVSASKTSDRAAAATTTTPRARASTSRTNRRAATTTTPRTRASASRTSPSNSRSGLFDGIRNIGSEITSDLSSGASDIFSGLFG